MAKGQKHSSKEIRKPKKDKPAPKQEVAFGNQVKLAGADAKAPQGKR
ncbi:MULTISPECIES: hypothetical protein [unclassified Rhizobium]|nr:MULTISPECIES: hypothetical protein [unclassified Rhizobium]MBB1248715.1 hypothetical protein [Rhizobium sp. G21]MCV3766295.1 hypothetical protein [Rhizobium sp. TRM95796]